MDLVRSYLTTLVQILSYSSHVNTEGEPSIVSTAHFILFHFFFYKKSFVLVNF